MIFEANTASLMALMNAFLSPLHFSVGPGNILLAFGKQKIKRSFK